MDYSQEHQSRSSCLSVADSTLHRSGREFLFVDEDQLLPSSVPQRHSFGAGSLNELSVDEEIKMQAVLESEFTLRLGTWDNKRAAQGAALRAL